MAKKRKKDVPEKKSTTDYYKLNTKAVEDLAGATKENTPEYSKEELKKYRSKGGIKLPHWLVMFLTKAWFAGAVCFFIFWGLGVYLADALDMLVVFGAALGLVMDILVNNIIRYFEKNPGANDIWLMYPKKDYFSFFINIFYSYWLLFCVYTWYQFINGVLVMLFQITDQVPLGVEPILFGVFFAAFDFMFIGMKHLLRKIVTDAKKKPI